MNKTAKYLPLTACALAASLFLSGCGGAEGTDTVAPTVAITSAAVGSTVTFTFTFSEALGTGTGDALTKDEVTVQGGTAGTFNVVDSTHATLVVTATAATVSVSVAANKFADVSHNFNTVVGTGTHTAESTGTACATGQTCVNFSASNLGFAPFNMNGGGTVAIAEDPADSSNKVMKFIKKAGDGEWTGTPIYTDLTNKLLSIGVAITDSNKTITLRARSAAAVGEEILVKLEGGAGGAVTEKRAATTKQNEWETLSFEMPANGNYTSLTIFNQPGKTVSADTTIYIDDVQYPTGNAAVIETCPTTLVDGKFASGYSGTLDAGLSKECGLIGKYIFNGIDAIWYDGGVAGTAGDPSFYFGWGFLPSSLSESSYFGAFVKAPSNGTANISAYSKVSVTTWTWDDQTNKGVTGSVVLKGPSVDGCQAEAKKSVSVTTPLGAKTYSLNLNEFTLTTACTYAKLGAFLAGGIAEVHVQYAGVANMNNALNLNAETGRAANGMNLGKVIFGN